MKKRRQFSSAVKLWVGSVICTSMVAFFMFGDAIVFVDAHFFTVLVLSALIGSHSMRYSPSSMELSSSHPFLIYGLATFGPRSAILIIVVGLLTMLAMSRNRIGPFRFVFNLAAIVLSTEIAAGVFGALGGVPGLPIADLLFPLLGAAITYLITNSVLISMVVSFDRPDVRFLKACADALQWGSVAYLTGYATGIAVLYATAILGKPAIFLVLPPCWLLLSFYKMHESRLETERLRTSEVQTLNAELSRSVEELQQALVHIKQLRGLLPICMHCKSIRDDQDVWHRVEAYLAEHSDAHLTHSLCESCREIYYPDVPKKKDPTPA